MGWTAGAKGRDRFLSNVIMWGGDGGVGSREALTFITCIQEAKQGFDDGHGGSVYRARAGGRQGESARESILFVSEVNHSVF